MSHKSIIRGEYLKGPVGFQVDSKALEGLEFLKLSTKHREKIMSEVWDFLLTHCLGDKLTAEIKPGERSRDDNDKQREWIEVSQWED